MRELSLNVMDIAQNSISAGASLITITVEEDAELDELSISIGDNGRGMTPEQVDDRRAVLHRVHPWGGHHHHRRL